MKTIRENSFYELIIKNSKFITLLIKVADSNEVSLILEKVKNKYPKATHYCYCYIIGDKKYANDDNEPANTAGRPMLNVLEKEEIMNVVCITIRYFGGIKLGAGGLIRAYAKGVKKALENSLIMPLEKGYVIALTFDYSRQKQIDYLVKDFKIISKDYQEEVIYVLQVPISKIDLFDNYSYQILSLEYIEKIH